MLPTPMPQPLLLIAPPMSTTPTPLKIPGEVSFVREDLIKQLNLLRSHSSMSIIGIGGRKSTTTRGIVSLTLHSNYSNASVRLRAHVLPTLTTILPSTNMDHQEWPHLKNLKLADPDFMVPPRSIDVIIGADSYGHVIKPNLIKGLPSTPIAQLSIFGWLVIGPVGSASTRALTSHQEEVPIANQSQRTPKEQECEDHFRTTHLRDPDGRYIVRIPLKLPSTMLGTRTTLAHACLNRTLRKLKRNEEDLHLYQEFMEEYENLQHMKRASSRSSQHSTTFYLPHHGVLKPDSPTTKLRVVFNGSSSTSSGYSLNDIMHTGETYCSTSLTCSYGFVSTDTHSQPILPKIILWVDKDLQETQFQLTTVTYGTKAAPYLAVRTLLQLAEDEGHHYPLAVPSITHARYVDDIFGGADSPEDLKKLAHQLQGLCNAGGFPLASGIQTAPRYSKPSHLKLMLKAHHSHWTTAKPKYSECMEFSQGYIYILIEGGLILTPQPR
ncbi:uncharacterized protein LOC122404376 [Colletes gigas]|uniref:uncharacterized protein LOC122404376 n=1 Tax=Colletes gigas TaxID=935657 RepID=UPI001C9B45FB|nr:uncharacterized protein LOC122404376 [Colletes gigas]